MNETEFTQDLATRGCSEPQWATLEANRHNPEHAHTYVAYGMVLEGEFTIRSAKWVQHVTAGGIFEVPAGTPHTETVGVAGVRLVVGRLQPPGQAPA